jgi:hypothetical protein
MQSQYTAPRRPRRSVAAFDALFSSITRRTDIRSDAKVVYAKLTTMVRLGESWTQPEIGELTGLSRHQTWRALGELIRAELVTSIRHGLGRPNSYILRGVDEEDLYGQADTPAARARRIRTVRLQQLIEIYGEMCLRCGVTGPLEIDHVIPKASGGPDVFSNLQLLCKPCNQAKGNTIADYRSTPGAA